MPYLNTVSRTIPYLKSLSRTLPYFNTLSRTIPHLNTLSRTMPDLNTVSRTMPYLNTVSRTMPYLNILLFIPYPNTLPAPTSQIVRRREDDPSRIWTRPNGYTLSFYMEGHPPHHLICSPIYYLPFFLFSLPLFISPIYQIPHPLFDKIRPRR